MAGLLLKHCSPIDPEGGKLETLGKGGLKYITRYLELKLEVTNTPMKWSYKEAQKNAYSLA